jgi:hypothetical protein
MIDTAIMWLGWTAAFSFVACGVALAITSVTQYEGNDIQFRIWIAGLSICATFGGAIGMLAATKFILS